MKDLDLCMAVMLNDGRLVCILDNETCELRTKFKYCPKYRNNFKEPDVRDKNLRTYRRLSLGHDTK